MKATFLQNRCISTLKYYNKRDGEILIIHCYKIRDVVLIPGLGRSPGGGHGNHSYILAWRIPGTGEPGGLPSMGLHRVRHD